jgi:hypothetical protein
MSAPQHGSAPSRDAGRRTISEVVHEFPWIHRVLGLCGNTAFFVGSILFFFEALKTTGIWLFVIGSLLMLVGSAGEFLVRWFERDRS